MNIHALLATQPPQGQSSTSGQSSPSANTEAGGFLQALGQASLSGEGHISRSRPLAGEGRPDTQATRQQITEQLKALGLSDAQLQGTDMQALIEKIRQQPDMAQSLQTLVATLEQDAGALPPLTDSTESTAPADASALDEIARRMDLLATFGESTDTDADATQWRQALNDLLQAEDSPAEPLAGLLAAMVQAPANVGTGSEALSASALRGALLSAQTSAQASSAQPDARQAGTSDGTAMLNTAAPAPSSINVSASPVSGDALMAALTTANAESSQQSQQPLAGAMPPALAGASVNATPGAAPVQASVTAPLTSAAWPQQLGQQLAQFTQRSGEQQVKLQIHPAELGPLSISLKVSEHGGTQAHFLSAHAQVRQVVEQAIPQLREALAEQGISLGDTSVGEQQTQDESAFAESGQPGQGSGISGDGESGSDELPVSAQTLAIDGRVDLYA
jgi:flagellar hook-length control protein FliK